MTQSSPAAIAESDMTPEQSSDVGTPPRILVVDDDATILELLEDLLVEEGYEVETAADGHQALEALDSRLYDLVLLDINLPGPDGLTVLGAAPRFQTDAQYVVMTASPSRPKSSSWCWSGPWSSSSCAGRSPSSGARARNPGTGGWWDGALP